MGTKGKDFGSIPKRSSNFRDYFLKEFPLRNSFSIHGSEFPDSEIGLFWWQTMFWPAIVFLILLWLFGRNDAFRAIGTTILVWDCDIAGRSSDLASWPLFALHGLARPCLISQSLLL